MDGTPIFCSPANASATGAYFGQLHDDFSFCVHAGTPGQDQGKVWCKNTSSTSSTSSSSLSSSVGGLTHCSFANWNSFGRDTSSLVQQDPLFEDAPNRNFALKSGSPALGLGIVSIDMSTVGPLPLA